jgi:steroid 5-alpha reductase family enzyme
MDSFLFAGIVIFCYMVFFYLVSRIVKNNSIVDIGWGSGFIITAFSLLIHTGNLNLQSVIIMSMIMLWGIRLTIHIFLRNKGKGEDFRYAEWRKNTKKDPEDFI